MQGLKPVVSGACNMRSGDMDLDEEREVAKLKYVAQEAPVEALRDIASAPF